MKSFTEWVEKNKSNNIIVQVAGGVAEFVTDAPEYNQVVVDFDNLNSNDEDWCPICGRGLLTIALTNHRVCMECDIDWDL
jgi:uncharacterized protein (DUF983 family)